VNYTTLPGKATLLRFFLNRYHTLAVAHNLEGVFSTPAGLGRRGAPARIRHVRGHVVRTQGEIEAAISDGISRFEQEYMGRGPKDIRAHLIAICWWSVSRAC